MFTTLRRIAAALERLVELKSAEVALLRAETETQQKTRELVARLNDLFDTSNTRATWYHAESTRLQHRIEQLGKQVQQLQVFQ